MIRRRRSGLEQSHPDNLAEGAMTQGSGSLVTLGVESTFNNCCVCVLDRSGNVTYERGDTFHAPPDLVQDTTAWRDRLAAFHSQTLPVLLNEALQRSACPDFISLAVVAGKHNRYVEVARTIVDTVARRLSVPVVTIDHHEAHLLAGLLCDPPPAFPYIGLTAAGGHSHLHLVNGLGDYVLLGSHETARRNRFGHGRAPGAVLDRCAELLGIVPPGQPDGAVAIDACSSRTSDRPYHRFVRTIALNAANGYDFDYHALYEEIVERRDSGFTDSNELLAVSAQECVMTILLDKAFAAASAYRARSVSFGGGVACNRRLRELAAQRATRQNIAVHFPEKAVCADNARMIAFAGLLTSTHVPSALAGEGKR